MGDNEQQLELSPLEKSILKTVRKQGLTEAEIKRILKQAKSPDRTIKTHKHNFSKDFLRIGLFGDSHIGHKEFDEDLWLTAADYWNQTNVDAIYHTGDVIEGMSNREGHVYELDDVGVSAQVRRAAQLLNYMPKMVYGITGNHENWALRKANQGVVVGELIEDKAKNNFTYLGMDIADIILDDEILLRLQHPGDGTAYAISYKTQKMIDAMDVDDRPTILGIGHYHKAEYIYYRDIHAFQTGTICGQTPFMRGKGLAAHKGFWTLDLYKSPSDGRLEKMCMEFFPAK